MSEWEKLYIGNEAAAEDLSAFLESRSVQSLKTVVQGQIISRTGARESAVRVDVRPCEMEAASVAFAEWTAPQAGRAESLSRRILGIVLTSTIPSFLWVGVYYLGLPGVPFPQPTWALGLWFVSLIVVSQVEDRRSRSATIGRAV